MSKDKINLSEHVNALFEGVDGVSDEQKAKMETVIEAAISAILTEEQARLNEEFETKLNEGVETKVQEINESVSKYLDYVVGEWVEENRIAIESGIQLEHAKSFFEGMKELFMEHNVEVPEGKEDLVEIQESKIAELQAKLNESTETLISLKEELDSIHRKSVIEESTKDLTDTQREKFAKLVEGIEFKDKKSFEEKVKTIRESFFVSSASGADTQQSLNEETIRGEENPLKRRMAAIRNPYKFSMSK